MNLYECKLKSDHVVIYEYIYASNTEFTRNLIINSINEDERIVDTSRMMMDETHNLMIKNGCYEEALSIIDFYLPEKYDCRVIVNINFDFVAITNYMGKDGIFIDCYIRGYYDDSDSYTILKIGTYKSLRTDVEAMKLMGNLADALAYYNWVYLNYCKRYIPSLNAKANSNFTNSFFKKGRLYG